MKRLLLVVCAVITVSAPVFSQTGPLSIADLDRETEKTAEFLSGRAENGVAGTPGESPFTDYWIQNILAILAEKPGITVFAEPGRADYLLKCSVLELGQTVRVYTTLVKRADTSVGASWTTDFTKTPFLDGLLAAYDPSGVRPDQYEPDSRENPVLIEADGELRRTLHTDDEDWFSFSAAEDDYYIIETTGNVDTYMELYLEDNLIAEDDDGGQGGNARIAFLAKAGKRYLVKVRGYSGNDTGTYVFRCYRFEAPDKHMKPNNTRELAFPIPLETEIKAFLAEGGGDDENWYKVTIPSGAYCIIWTEGKVDTLLAFFDEKGSKLAEDDDSGSETNARIAMPVEEGVYFVRVTAYEGGGEYSLYTALREMNQPDAYENDDEMENAKSISAGESQIRTFTTEDDVDWAFLVVGAKGSYAIRAEGVENAELDPYLALFDADGKIIAEDDDSGGGYAALIKTRLEPGRYYIRVTALNSSGTYRLSVARE